MSLAVCCPFLGAASAPEGGGECHVPVDSSQDNRQLPHAPCVLDTAELTEIGVGLLTRGLVSLPDDVVRPLPVRYQQVYIDGHTHAVLIEPLADVPGYVRTSALLI